MTELAWALLASASVCALFDWAAVARENKHVEYVAKPATIVFLVAVAISVETPDHAQRILFVVALVLSGAGDTFLMLRNERFLLGLGSFLLAHLFYIAGFVAGDLQARLLLPWGVALLAVSAFPGRLVLRAASRRDRRLTVPVAAYVVAITAMLTSAGATADILAIAGAFLFYVSDTMIGVTRFVRTWPGSSVAIIVTYHLAQGLLIVSLVD